MIFQRRFITACICILTLVASLVPAVVPSATATAPIGAFDSHSKSVIWYLGRWWDPTINNYNWTGIQSDLDDIQKANITWIKTYFTINTAYSVYDRLIPLLQARGINLQATINSPQKYYLATDSTYKTNYKTWVSTLVSKYSWYIKYWEIYNEPNLHYFWNIDENSPDNSTYAASVADYIALLKDSYQSIKASDPSAKVILGGLASWKMSQFVDELIKQNAQQYFDIMGYHPYPDWSKPNPDGVIDQVNNLKAKMATQSAMAAKPIWVSEVGFNTAVNDPGAVGDEGVKANYLVDMMNKLRSNGITYPINWSNFSQLPSEQKTWGQDLMRKDTSTLQATYLPSYAAYRDLWTNTSTTTPPIPANATTLTILPSSDTYVDSANPNTNYGTASQLAVNASMVTYLKFDLSSLAGTTLDAIKLRVKTSSNTDAGSGAQQFVKTCDTSWSETTMTYANQASVSVYSVGGGIMNTTYNTWYDIPLYAPDLQPKMGQTLCLALVSLGSDSFNFNSRETADKPQLTITQHSSAGVTTYAADSFGRTVTDSWGKADTGGSYILSGTAANFDVTGSVGTISVPANSGQAAYLTSMSALNTSIRVRVQTDKLAAGSAQTVYLIARRASNGNEYHGRLQFGTDGSLSLQADRYVAGTTTPLGTQQVVAGVTQAANRYFWVQTQVIGANPTTIRMKAWADGQAEPSTWLYSTTDTDPNLQTGGGVGLRAALRAATNAPVLFTFDDFQVTNATS